jgi:putative oxidoreductase
MSANLNVTATPYASADNPALNQMLLLVGRVLIALLFIVFGYLKLTNFGGTVGYFAKWGFPLPPATAVVAIVFELGFGALLAIGWKARWWALALALYTVIAAAVAHRYWTYDPAQQFAQMSFFFKNLAIIGGLLCIAAAGAGRYSVDKH